MVVGPGMWPLQLGLHLAKHLDNHFVCAVALLNVPFIRSRMTAADDYFTRLRVVVVVLHTFAGLYDAYQHEDLVLAIFLHNTYAGVAVHIAAATLFTLAVCCRL